MESEENANLAHSVLEQKDEINPFSNQNKAGAHLRGKQETLLQLVFAMSFKRMVHVCEETVSTIEWKVVKLVPALDLCQK